MNREEQERILRPRNTCSNHVLDVLDYWMNLERNLNEQITLPTQEPGFDVMGTAENKRSAYIVVLNDFHCKCSKGCQNIFSFMWAILIEPFEKKTELIDIYFRLKILYSVPEPIMIRKETTIKNTGQEQIWNMTLSKPGNFIHRMAVHSPVRIFIFLSSQPSTANNILWKRDQFIIMQDNYLELIHSATQLLWIHQVIFLGFFYLV